MIDCLLDTSLKGQVRQDFIIANLLLLVSDPKTRVYFRPETDLCRILHIFTQVDGIDKEPKQEALDQILTQM